MENVHSVSIFRATLLGSLVAFATAPALAQGPVAPPSGLAAWWTMDRNADDIGPSGLNGALVGPGGTFGPGHVDGAFQPSPFDGHLSLPDAPSLDVSNSFTFEFWVRQDVVTLDRTYLVNKGTANHLSTPYAFGIIGSNGFLPVTPGASLTGFPAPGRPFLVVSDGTLEQVLIASTAVPVGPYTHLAFSVHPVNTGFQSRIYMNGSLTGWNWLSRRPFPGTDSLKLAGIPGMQSLNGQIDEVTLYDRALTLTEVQAIFAAGPDGKVKPNFDRTPPVVTITEPADGAVLASRLVAVSADVMDESSTRVVSDPVGLTAALPAGGGTATGTVSLDAPDGAALIAVTATDEAGNSAANSVTVFLDTTPPAVTVLSPGEGAVFGTSPAPFAVQVNDSTATTLRVGGEVRSLPAGQNAVTVDVPLVEGSNPVVVAVTDSAGNRTELVRTVVLDLSVPAVAILSPPDGALFGAGESAAAVSAQVDDLTATRVGSVPDGVSGSLPAGGGLVSGAVALQEGLNRITVSATDEAGRSGAASVTVNFDTTGPNVAFLSPFDGDPVRGIVEVVVSAADVAPGSGVARIDLFAGTRILASMTGGELRFDLDTAILPDGDHTLRAVAVDGAANESSALLMLTTDNTAPTVQILSPVAGIVQGLVEFTAVASDSGTGLVSVIQLAGQEAPQEDGSATFDPPVPSYQANGSVDTATFLNGPLVFEVQATDLVGNSTVAQVQVDVQNDLPDAPGLKPRDGKKVHGVVNLKVSSDRADLNELELLVDGRSVGTAASSPLVVRFDTATRMDGPMEVTGWVRTDSGSSQTVHTLHVDNMRLRTLLPSHISLSKGRRSTRHVFALVTGPNVDLLQPLEHHQIELRAEGCSPVPMSAARSVHHGHDDDDELEAEDHRSRRHHRHDDDGEDDRDDHRHGRKRHHLMVLSFDREALVSALRAARATGAVRGKRVKVSLFVDGAEIGETKLRVRGERHRGRRR